MKVALDTNVLAHAEEVNGSQAKKAAIEILGALPQGAVVVSGSDPGRIVSSSSGESRLES
jgi:predicted nucleic acid-binding protein